MKNYGLDEILDIVTVGAGPAALSVLFAARAQALRAVAIDKGPVAGALTRHPTYMKWFSTADKLELGGFPLMSREKNPTRAEYLKYLRTFTAYFGLEVAAYREVTNIISLDGLFRVEARDAFGRPYVWRARNVVLATGFYDSPRMLGLPGEDLPHVSHRYSEPHAYAGHDVVIVGAGSSAAETALELYRAGCRVTIAMREQEFQTKYWIKPDLENRIAEGAIACHRGVEVEEFQPDATVLRDAHGAEITVPCDFVLAMTGYEPDTGMLEAIGAEVDSATRKPVLTEALETTVPGAYVAGTLCAGSDANVVFVENSREHGPRIVGSILEKRGARQDRD